MAFFQQLAVWQALRTRPLLGIVLVSALINAGVWVAALQLFPRQSAAVVLHYNVEAGIDFVGQGTHITVLPLAGSILLILNLVVGLAATTADRRVAWILWSVIPLLQLVIAAAFYFIWQINS